MGRYKLLTPEQLWDLFLEYKSNVKGNPAEVQDYVGKDATQVYRQRERPLIMEGFECFVADQGPEFPVALRDYFANTNKVYENFSTVCTRIKMEIRNDQVSGGMINIYNPSITARVAGLVEKTETNVIREQPLFGDE